MALAVGLAVLSVPAHADLSREFLQEAADLLKQEADGKGIDVHALFEAAKAGKKQRGARGLLHGAEIKQVGLEMLSDRAMDANLGIRVANRNRAYAKARVEETDSAYDPTFTLSLNYSRTETYNRGQAITRMREDKSAEEDTETFVLGCVVVDGDPVLATDTNDDDGGYNCGRTPIWGTQYEFASVDDGAARPRTWTSKLALAKSFDWGGSVDFSFWSEYDLKHSFSVDAFKYAGPSADPFGWGSRMPWTTNYSFGMSSPVPWMKGFGEAGSQSNLDMAVADTNFHTARHTHKLESLSVLESLMNAYWGLAQGIEELKATVAHREALEERLERVTRRFDLGLVTTYDVKQVEAEIAKTRSSEELIWNSYLTNSNTVWNLVSSGDPGEDSEVFFPVGFEALLVEPVELDEDRVYEEAVANHPSVKIGMETVKAAQAEMAFRENQMLPDIQLSFSLNASQVDTTYGYKSWRDSVEQVFQPDQVDLTIGVTWNIPLWETAENAAFARAKATAQKANDQIQNTRNQLTEQISAAITSLRSAESLILQTQQDLKLAGFAYEKGASLVDRGLLSEFELLSRHQDLLSARKSHIAALFNYRKAHVSLLSAQGTLDEYVSRIAFNQTGAK